MKNFVMILVCTALLLAIACTVQEFYINQEYVPAVSDKDDKYAHLHTSADNTEQPWNLILVNNWNKIPENHKIHLVSTSRSEMIDKQILPNIEAMFADARSNGHSPEITSGYRSEKEQKKLLENRIKEYKSLGYSKKESTSLALDSVAKPGFSEHETGLAIDINSTDGDSWELYMWLEDNCHKYGFILRYPDGKEDITGIDYEPWHFRYVGEEAAEYIYTNDITLEEYILL